MNRTEKIRRESLILAIAVTVMALKIMFGVILFHRWRMREAELGRPVSLDDELE
jgi:hypothetical protein